MKTIAFALSFLFASQSFAGAYSLNCASKDQSIKIEFGQLNVTATDGRQIEAEYYSTSDTEIPGAPLQNFLKQASEMLVIERPELVMNKLNPVKVTSKRNYKDTCGNVGQARRFKETVRVLDSSGNELRQAEIVCSERAIPGHCI